MSEIISNVYDLRERLKKNYQDVGIAPLVTVEATTLDDLYFQLVIGALKKGRLYKIDSGSFANSHRIEFDKVSFCVKNPTSRPLAPQPRQGIPPTTTDENIEDYFVNYIMDGSLQPNEHYKYSSWIVGIPESIPLNHNDIPRGSKTNQLEECIFEFTEKGYGTNHPCMRVGSSESMLRYKWSWKDETDRGTSECLIYLTPKIKNNKLNLSCGFRSWDLFAGLPENLGGFVMLMEYMVDQINDRKKPHQPEIQTGFLYGESDGLHIYEHNLDLAKIWANIDDEKNGW